MALIALLAAFALAGGVGPSSRGAAVSSGAVSVELTYPTVLRTGMPGMIEGRVVNHGRAPVSPVMALDAAYADRVSDVSSVPDAEAAYVIRFADLAPGERRAFRIAFEARDFGRVSGDLTISEGGRSRKIRLSTFVYP